MTVFSDRYLFEDEVFGNDRPGFYVGKLSASDSRAFRELVLSAYRKLVQESYPDASPDHLKFPELYHQFAIDDIHKSVFTQKARTLSRDSANKILELDVFKILLSRYPGLTFSMWESGDYPDFIWRVIRPGPKDLSPIHSDKWFWDIGLGTMPQNANFHRVKGWVAILSEFGRSGLSVLPGSHNYNYEPSHELRDGLRKPFLDQKVFSGKMKNLELDMDNIVFFHDNLIHGGFSRGLYTRFSLEFTLLLPEN